MNNEEIYTRFNMAVKGVVDLMIDSQTPFYIIIDPKKNWIPSLPDEYQDTQGILFHIIDDSLTGSIVNEEHTSLLIAIPVEDGRLSIHNYIVDETSNIILVGESNNREKGRVIIERPNFIFDIGKEIENDQLHSIDHFLKNPNNAKFFK